MTTAAIGLGEAGPLEAEPTLRSLDPATLQAQGLDHLQQSRAWTPARHIEGITLATGRLRRVPTRAYRSDLTLDTPPAELVRHLADNTFEELARWSGEFMRGEYIDTLEESPERAVWIVRASYRTPAPLCHREYVYRFSRERLDADRTLIMYRSTGSDLSVQTGFVRAVLYPSAHLVTALPHGHSRLEHVLATDLRGRFPVWLQNGPLRGAMLDAHARDSRAQLRLWGAG